MNASDSLRIEASMAPLGYRATNELTCADLIVINTCAIRDKAEQKVYSFLGRLAEIKRSNAQVLIAVGGCVAQQAGRTILKRMPHVDIIFGTHALGRLPGLVGSALKGGRPLVDIDFTTAIEDRLAPIEAENSVSDGPARFITIMQGCDNYCTYCVVPYVRGREVSRSPEAIIGEVKALVDNGVREVTLLGQNVNSYGQKEGMATFGELLAALEGISDLHRIRFTTSHPKDLSPELVEAFGQLRKLCRHIHLPVQSGADRILKRMNRRYTRQDYLEKVALLREACPDIAITTDFIVGFPGETEADFQATMELVAQVRFDGLFAFKYSDRPQAPATQFQNKLPDGVKQERLRRLLDYQDQVNIAKNRELIGSHQEILVDGFSKKMGENGRRQQWSGRTTGNRIVNFAVDLEKPDPWTPIPGQLLDMRIEKAFPHSLWGAPLPESDGESGMKGAMCNVVQG